MAWWQADSMGPLEGAGMQSLGLAGPSLCACGYWLQCQCEFMEGVMQAWATSRALQDQEVEQGPSVHWSFHLPPPSRC